MSGMKDLLGDTPYPEYPGHKERTTSRAAAAAVAPSVNGGRTAVLRAIAAAGDAGLTADEAAAIVERRPSYVRPRVTELSAMGHLIDTGRRRPNDTGLMAKVWRAR